MAWYNRDINKGSLRMAIKNGLIKSTKDFAGRKVSVKMSNPWGRG